MRHVFVETNWVVDYAAPAHHKKKQRLIFSTVLPRESSSFIFRPFA